MLIHTGLLLHTPKKKYQMKFPREKISASLMNCYFDCPLSWKLQFVDELMVEEGPALEIGSMLDYMFKIHHQGKDWQEEAKKKYFSGRSFKQRIDNFGVARSLMEVYIKDPDKFENPKFDIGFKVPIVNPITEEQIPGINLTGYLDGIEYTSEPRIIELKSTTEDYTQEKVDNAIQATIYSYALYRRESQIYPVDYIVLSKKTKTVSRFRTTRTLEDFAALFEKIKKFIKDVEDEKFDQNPDHPYYCACRKLS